MVTVDLFSWCLQFLYWHLTMLMSINHQVS